MSIENALFVVQRNGQQLSCKGSELKDKLQDGDLMVVQHENDDEASKWEVEAKGLPPWLPLYEGQSWHIKPKFDGTDNVKVQNAAVIYYADTFEEYTGSPTSLAASVEYVVCGPSVSFKNSTQDFTILERYTDTSQFSAFSNLFYNCTKFRGDGAAYIDTSSAEYLSYMFTNCENFGLGTNCRVDHFDLTNVKGIKFMFSYCSNMNLELGNWDVDQVRDFSGLFGHCKKFNQDLSGWNTVSATNMSSMFVECLEFNGNVSGFKTGNVTNFGEMFASCEKFDQDISSYDTSKAQYMNGMFNRALVFNRDLSGWDTGEVTNMTSMFMNAEAFSQDLSGWCVSKISSKPQYFNSGSLLTDDQLPRWGTCPDTSNRS